SMESEMPCSTGTSTSPRLYFLVTASSSSRTSPMRAPSENPPQTATGLLRRAGRSDGRRLVRLSADDFGHELIAGLQLSFGDFGRAAVGDADADADGVRLEAREDVHRANVEVLFGRARAAAFALPTALAHAAAFALAAPLTLPTARSIACGRDRR